MSDKGFDVDTEAVRAVVEKLRPLRGDFDEVAEYAAGADPDWWTWGVQGLVMSQQYEVAAEQIRVVLGKLGPAMEGLVARVEAACEDYEGADGAASEEVCGAGGELDQPGSSDV